MESIEIGIQGAKVQSWGKNPRGLLKRLIDRSPSATKIKLLEEFRELVKRDEECLDVMIEYWFSNNYHSLVDHERQDRKTDRRVPTSADIKGRIAAKVEEEAKLMLLDLVLPNGKKLRECTGSECRQMAGKMGSWLGKIAAKIKSSDIVGKRLTEEDVRRMYVASR